MAVFEDLTGMKFGRLTVLELDHKEPHKPRGFKYFWKCHCECGNECIIRGDYLKSGTSSCGCLGGKFKDLTGQTFDKLTVIERAENNKHGQVMWRCRCSCGNFCTVASNLLIGGNTKSCGCLRHQAYHKTHGLSASVIYRKYKDILSRCYNPNRQNYERYGGRGITICEEWKNNFQAFYDYVSKLEHFDEKGYSLDRIDNNGNYEPSNVRWADNKTQCRNKRNNVIVEYQGQKMTLAEASEKSGINVGTLLSRIKRGDTGERLFRTVKGR